MVFNFEIFFNETSNIFCCPGFESWREIYLYNSFQFKLTRFEVLSSKLPFTCSHYIGELEHLPLPEQLFEVFYGISDTVCSWEPMWEGSMIPRPSPIVTRLVVGVQRNYSSIIVWIHTVVGISHNLCLGIIQAYTSKTVSFKSSVMCLDDPKILPYHSFCLRLSSDLVKNIKSRMINTQ